MSHEVNDSINAIKSRFYQICNVYNMKPSNSCPQSYMKDVVCSSSSDSSSRYLDSLSRHCTINPSLKSTIRCPQVPSVCIGTGEKISSRA